MPITGIGLMTSFTDNQSRRIHKEQTLADQASKRLTGSLDAYSSHAQTATVGLQSEVQVSHCEQELGLAQSMLQKQKKMDSQINLAMNISHDLAVYLQSLRGGVGQVDVGSIKTYITNASSLFISVLNESIEGQYLLGGDNPYIPCVDKTIAQTPMNQGDAISFDFYKGGKSAGFVVLGDMPIDQFPVTAMEPCFASTLTALRLMMNPAVSDNRDDPLLLQAIQVLDESRLSYSSAVNASATNTKNVESVCDKLKTMISSAQETVKETLGTDEYEDLIAQMSAMHNLQLQQDMMLSRIESIRTMLSRAR